MERKDSQTNLKTFLNVKLRPETLGLSALLKLASYQDQSFLLQNN